MNPKLSEKLAFFFLTLSGIVVVIPIFLVLYYLISKGMPAINIEFLTQMPRGGMREGGIFPAIIGTLWLVVGAIFISLPLGLISAVYLTEYAGKNWFVRIIRLSIVNLAGVPSVVFGLFGLGLFVIFLKFGASILSGALTLAFLILPLIITASEEAIVSVPKSFREASLALGATKFQTIKNVVLPNAAPGILTGTLLGISRVAGETAPILFTVAAFFLPRLPHSIFEQVMALPYHLYIMSTQVPNVPEKTKYGIALVLVGLVFGVNICVVIYRNGIRKRKKW